jgi:hypothetical protein
LFGDKVGSFPGAPGPGYTYPPGQVPATRYPGEIPTLSPYKPFPPGLGPTISPYLTPGPGYKVGSFPGAYVCPGYCVGTLPGGYV